MKLENMTGLPSAYSKTILRTARRTPASTSRLLRVVKVVDEVELDVEPDTMVDTLKRVAQHAEHDLRPHLPLEDPPVLDLPE